MFHILDFLDPLPITVKCSVTDGNFEQNWLVRSCFGNLPCPGTVGYAVCGKHVSCFRLIPVVC